MNLMDAIWLLDCPHELGFAVLDHGVLKKDTGRIGNIRCKHYAIVGGLSAFGKGFRKNCTIQTDTLGGSFKVILVARHDVGQNVQYRCDMRP